MIEDLLHAEAQQLHDQYDSHDTDDFLRRLAVRIAQDAARPSRIARAVTDAAPPPASAPRRAPPASATAGSTSTSAST